MRWDLLATLGPCAAALVGCGGVGTDCPTGTTAFDGGCVLIDPDDTTPPVTRATPAIGPVRQLPSSITLFTDEPATLYYTLDGSEPTTASAAVAGTLTLDAPADGTSIGYFAVDFLGNVEATKRGVLVVDTVGPGAPSAVTADESPDHTIEVAWQAPGDEDLAGFVVVRSYAGAVPVPPTPGVRYAVGDELAPQQQVVAVGDATAFTDAAALPGFNLYAVWPYDRAGNVGARGAAWGHQTDVPTQLARLRVTLAPTPTIEVLAQPAQATVSATPLYDVLNARLTVRLTLRNDVARVLHNPKLVVTELGAGALVNGAGVLAGDPFLAMGPASIGALGEQTRDLILGGIDGTVTQFEVELRLVTHPLLVIGETNQLRVGDSFPSGRFAPVPAPVGQAGPSQYTEGVFSRDGSKLLLGDGRTPALIVVDTATLTAVEGPRYVQRGFIDSLALARDGQHVFAVLNTVTHRKLFRGGTTSFDYATTDTEVIVLKLDAHTLEEVGRLVLDAAAGDSLARSRGHRLTLTVDGTRGALAIKNDEAVYHLDLETLTLLARYPVDSGVALQRVRYAAIAPDGGKIYVAYRGVPNRLDVIDLATGMTSPLAITSVSGSGNPGDLVFGPSGRLYYSRKQIDPAAASLIIFNLGAGTQAALFPGASIKGLDFSPDGAIAYAADADTSTARAISTATDLEVDADGDAGNGLTAVPSGFPRAHVVLISP